MMSDHEDDNSDFEETTENGYDDQDDREEFEENSSYDKKSMGSEEIKLANILLYGSTPAKQEVLIKLIYIGNINALGRVLNSFSDIEYNRIVPCA